MDTGILCDPYIWENPLIVGKTPFFYSTNITCVSELTNQVILVAVVLGCLASISWRMNKSYLPLIAILAAAILIVSPSILAANKIQKVFQRREAFQDLPGVHVIGKSKPGPGTGYDRTMPTSRNPFMNVLVDEVRYNPARPAAASVLDPNVQDTLDDFFRTEFNRDPTDVFGRSQSQRQFITMPATSIPNDVDSYQNWLYKIPGKTCKEGGPCIPGTDGGALPWLNVAEPSAVANDISSDMAAA